MNDEIVIRNIDYPELDAEPCTPSRDPVHGAVSPLAHRSQTVPRARSEVVAGFRSQQLRIRLADRLLVFSAAERPDPFPFEHPVLLVSTSVHDYSPKDPGVPHLTAVALAGDRQWLDRLCVVRDDVAGWAAARELGGRFLVRWRREGAGLVDLATAEVVTRWQMQGRTLAHRCCPLIPDALPGDQCKMHGGPWVSLSIVAAGHWNDRRALYLDELGCDESCVRRDRSPGPVPTRYDTWLPQDEFLQPEMHNDGHCRVNLGTSGQHKESVAVVDPIPGVTVVRDVDGRTWCQGIDERLSLSRGRIIEIGCAEHQVQDVLGRLQVAPTGGGEQLLDWDDAPRAWRAMDADLAHRYCGLTFVHRWVALGRIRVTGVQLGDVVEPMAFDLRGPGLLLPRVLVRFGACLMGEAHGWRLAQVQVRHGGHAQAHRCEGSDAQAVADWLLEERLTHLAAMFIEPLDPGGELTILERQRYYDSLIAVLGDARLGIAADALRAELASDDGYQRARAAMCEPHSDEAFWKDMASHGGRFGTREVFLLD